MMVDELDDQKDLQEFWREHAHQADFSVFQACGFFRQVGKNQYHLSEQAIIQAAERDFESPTVPTPTFNQYNVSNVQNSILNIDSTLENVRQSIHAAPEVEDATKRELERLVAELQAALRGVPSEYQDEVEAVREQAEQVGKALSKERINKRSLDVSSKGLIEAAKTLQAVTPSILLIATQIANALAPYL
ncbi:MAG TPA: hypothetical protein PKD09_22580 [Aggregatilinea sp.]|uniref:hypothetical protein n=1 Tax=Aggregatilinea sp. TaxID=2806333 RepID=UPI002D140EB6|nr:hypothetical protein [Aggregatilinea sp.]HML24458.1 hypothetical protein [Aggregatilinea sp.]